MNGKLSGKIALITGGSSGIGLATVKTFLAEDASVIAADLQIGEAQELKKKFGKQFEYVKCDVTEDTDLKRAMDVAEAQFGGLDILFNNAGTGGDPAPLSEITTAGWDRTMQLLVRSVASGMRLSFPLFRRRGGGAIINTASTAGLEAGWGPIAYSTAKAAVIHLSVCAAAEFAKEQIRVNSISPGLIMTPIFGGALGTHTDAGQNLIARVLAVADQMQPIKRGGRPEDIAQAALYLASDSAAFVTGENLVVDGGMTVGGRHSWDKDSPTPMHIAKSIS
jgi:NAD(P)-dependent dehydrogenase (short-subunit alcohol dehydrogenase family)